MTRDKRNSNKVVLPGINLFYSSQIEDEEGARINDTFRKIKVSEYSSKTHTVVSLLKFTWYTLYFLPGKK